MIFRFRMSTAVGALMAAGMIGASGAALAQADAAVAAGAENGVHAAPSSPVAGEALGPVEKAAAPVRTTRTRLRISTPPKLTLEPVEVPLSADDAEEAEAAPQDAAASPAAETAASARQAAVVAEEPMGREESAVYGRAFAEPAPAPEEPAPTQVAAVQSEAPDQQQAVAAEAGPPAAPEPQPQLAQAEPTPPAPDQAEHGLRQQVAFPVRSADAASAFARYMVATGRLTADFKDGAAVETALATATSYDAGQLGEGMIAYGAMAALQSPDFVYAVMDAAADEDSRRELIERILSNPAAATRLQGAEQAAALAGAAILREARPVVAAGGVLKQAAYDVQHQGWSTLKAADQQELLSQAKAAAGRRGAAKDGDVGKLLTRISNAPPLEDAGSAFTPVSVRSLALAALSILDGAAEADAERLKAVTSEPASSQCLKMAKLNLFQCLSVAGPEYENVYCLGQHAVLDTGQCVSAAARPLSPLLQASLSRDSSRVMVPSARMSRVQNSSAKSNISDLPQ